MARITLSFASYEELDAFCRAHVSKTDKVAKTDKTDWSALKQAGPASAAEEVPVASLAQAVAALDGLPKKLQGPQGKPNFAAIARSMLAHPSWKRAEAALSSANSLSAILSRRNLSVYLYLGRNKPVFRSILADVLEVTEEELEASFGKEKP